MPQLNDAALPEQLIDFIRKSPTAFHAVHTITEMLETHGFIGLAENADWKLTPGGKYYVVRSGSAVIAFTLPAGAHSGFQVIACHSDSPQLKIKESPEISVEGKYTKLNVERYGGMLCAPWFDRPLSAAGRVVVEADGRLESRLVDLDEDALLLPSLAIHMDRNANENHSYNIQKDMLPLCGCGQVDFTAMIAKAAGTEPSAVMGMDVFVYDRTPGTVWGAAKEFLSAPRLDDLECVFGALQGLLHGEESENINVLCVFDNEEVGSTTRQGAASTFLKDTLQHVTEALGGTERDYRRAVAAGFMISADNGHALHPNYPEKSDPVHRPVVNGGLLIKHSANQKYTTDAVSDAFIRVLCRRAGVAAQHYFNRSDMPGGSTLGNISGTQLPFATVDVGLPQLAMHSPYETVGVKDLQDWAALCGCFYGSTVQLRDDGCYDLK